MFLDRRPIVQDETVAFHTSKAEVVLQRSLHTLNKRDSTVWGGKAAGGWEFGPTSKVQAFHEKFQFRRRNPDSSPESTFFMRSLNFNKKPEGFMQSCM